MAMPSVQEMDAFIRAEAIKRGIDPNVAVTVARGEGLAPNTWQGKVQLGYGRERSYGPFQLHVAPAGYRQGMGNDFIKTTGLDPADPANWKQGVQFALDKAATGGWGPWFGAKANGITGMMGIKGGKALGVGGDGINPQNYNFANPEIIQQSGYNFAGSTAPNAPDSALSPVQGGVGGISPTSDASNLAGNFRPNNYQRTMLTSMGMRDNTGRGTPDPVTRGILKSIGLDPTGMKSLQPQQSGGLLSGFTPAATPGAAPSGGLLSFLKNLFG